MDNEFQDELIWLDRLNSDDDLFEREFLSINERFYIPDFNAIHDFVNENRGLIIILNKIEPLLENRVPYAQVYIELDNDPLFTPQLWLFVRAPKVNFDNGFKEDIKDINSIIRPYLFKLELTTEFFIYDGMIHPNHHRF